MKCKVDITAAKDMAAWVTRDAFMANVDLDDLACRESQDILDWYHPDWFRHDDNGDLRFTPPAFMFIEGQLRGINGRHRAVLLYRYLDVIPMLLVEPGQWPKDKISEIVERKIKEDEIIELPDLLINSALSKPIEENDSDATPGVIIDIKIDL
jgi:hypothetical protein